MDVLTNWRSCHTYPINTFQATLRFKLKSIDKKAIVAQRLKRSPTIIEKLRRYPTMKLSQMQDIGGLRAVVNGMAKLHRLKAGYEGSRFEHELVNTKDYLEHPKKSGYRGVHLVYRYKNRRASEYDNLLVELQFRTVVQHAWATAVETVGTFINYALKSSEGPGEWLEFFALAASAFALYEDSRPVPQFANLSRKETIEQLRDMTRKLEVRTRLNAYAIAANAISEGGSSGAFHLVTLNPVEKTVTIQPFAEYALEAANKEYTLTEQQVANGLPIQAVLVRAGPIRQLRRAYPNYFLDARSFIRFLDVVTGRRSMHRPRRRKNPHAPK